MSGKKCKYFLTISKYAIVIRTTDYGDLEDWYSSSIKVIKLDNNTGEFIWAHSQVYSYERDYARLVHSI